MERRKLSKAIKPAKTQALINAKSICRRTDFNYMNGHGTFYRFDQAHFPNTILDKSPGEHLSVVLYNTHTKELDEVVFELEGYSKLGKKCIWIHGFIDDIKDCFRIKFEYRIDEPLKSQILVYMSARPDYGILRRL